MSPAAYLAPLTAFAAALAAVWWLARSRLSAALLDRPNPRSLHEAPVPRTGGLGLHAGFLLALGMIAPGLPAALWLALGATILISLLDDARGVPPLARLAVHLAASAAFAAAVLPAEYGPLALAAAALAIAWMANLYNFMDGADGLAGGMALFGFGAYGAAAWAAGSAAFALVNFSLAAAAAAFLVFNFHPARIFLGDAGSVPLGFLAAALGAIGWLERDWTWWFPLLVFSPFIVDASVTLARRAWRREKLWQAHRDHYYQRLVRLGWGHRRTALAEYTLMGACALAALAALVLPPAAQAWLLAAAAAAYAALIAALERAWRRAALDRQS
ncbi:MAG TPA: glycosyltransferase family 4 protein [Burkholderiales bacterium]|nr:glycosyltransferase family 4 protein [Burkholderiales bacterium]